MVFQPIQNPIRPEVTVFNKTSTTTTITFVVATEGMTSLKIYDFTGKEIATLLKSWMNAGTHHVSLDASTLQPGVYFCKMQSGNFTGTIKIVLHD